MIHNILYNMYVYTNYVLYIHKFYIIYAIYTQITSGNQQEQKNDWIWMVKLQKGKLIKL